MEDTFGRHVMEELGCGALNWEDDVILIDKLYGERTAEANELLRKRTLERDSVAADAQHLAEDTEDLGETLVNTYYELALAYDALIEISLGTGPREHTKAIAIAALEANK